jgi:site-specific recombinase XerD
MNTTCSVIEVIDQYIGDQSATEGSRSTYRSALMKFFSFLAGSPVWNPTHEREVRLVTTKMIVSFKDEQDRKHASEYSTSLYITVVKSFFRWAAAKGIHDDVGHSVRSPKRRGGLCKDPLNIEQITMLMQSIDRTTTMGKRNYAIICLLYYNGLRGVEVIRMNNQDFITTPNGSFFYVQGKGHVNKDTRITVNKLVADAITAYQDTKHYYADEEPLFLSVGTRNLNNRISNGLIRKIVFGYLVSLGIKTDRISTHSLRHTAATLLNDSGVSRTKIMEFMRHSSYAVTERYISQLQAITTPDYEATNMLMKLVPDKTTASS